MNDRTCSIAGCGKSLYAKTLCAMHYQRARQAKPDLPTCSIPGCGKAVYSLSRLICRTHYNAESQVRHWARPERRAAHKVASDKNRSVPANRVKRNGSSKAWRESHPDRTRAQREKWRAAHPEQTRQLARQNQAVRRAHKQATTVGRVSYKAILARDGMVCHICALPILSLSDLHFDHVIPLAKGGPHIASNIKPSHALCNLRKHARIL